MILIIAGGRYYQFTLSDIKLLDDLHSEKIIQRVVSGCATGADTCGELYANRRGIPVDRFPPDVIRNPGPYQAWHIRNQEMADHSTHLAAFPGGTGTADMVRRAFAGDLVIYDWRYNR